MKLPGLFFLCAAILMFNACERHSPSELTQLEPASEHEQAHATEAKTEEPKPAKHEAGPAPKYFPDSK